MDRGTTGGTVGVAGNGDFKAAPLVVRPAVSGYHAVFATGRLPWKFEPLESILPEEQVIDHRSWRGDDWEFTVAVDFDQDSRKDILFGDYWGNDLGAIYTLGQQPGTVIRNNLIHEVTSYGERGRGIYLDEGSTRILVENNVVYRCKSSAFHYFDARGEDLLFQRLSFEEWGRRAGDKESLIADPRFVNPDRFQFDLHPGSPAFRVGFQPIDLANVGVRRPHRGQCSEFEGR